MKTPRCCLALAAALALGLVAQAQAQDKNARRSASASSRPARNANLSGSRSCASQSSRTTTPVSGSSWPKAAANRRWPEPGRSQGQGEEVRLSGAAVGIGWRQPTTPSCSNAARRWLPGGPRRELLCRWWRQPLRCWTPPASTIRSACMASAWGSAPTPASTLAPGPPRAPVRARAAGPVSEHACFSRVARAGMQPTCCRCRRAGGANAAGRPGR